METKRKAPAAPPTVVAEPAAPVPAAPAGVVPMALTVGHAEDAAEADADRMADTALRRLSNSAVAVVPQQQQHQHGPGCDHLRRTGAAGGAGGAVVGHEGGALDAESSAAINSRRGGGRQLEAGVLDRMQTAFSRDFSAVRIHDDAPAANLSRMVSARAFTTGQDIFFGRGEYNPSSAAGERMLAHELAHTVQQESAISRLVQRKASKVADNDAAVASVSRTLRLLRDHRFGSADRERAHIPASAMFGSRTASHSKMGLAALETAKEAAKKVGKAITKSLTGSAVKPVTVATQMADSAGDVFAAFEQAEAAIDPKYRGDLARIGAKAVEALVVGLTPQVLAAEPQVQEIFGRGAAEHQAMIAHGKGRVNQLVKSGELDTTGFHGTSSPILAGLKSGGGELLSMKELAAKNIAQTTGEGDTFSSKASLKDEISIGMGLDGLGTSSTYSALGMKVSHYNATLYTYEELVEEIRKLKVLAELSDDAMKASKADVINTDKVKKAAAELGVPWMELATMVSRITSGKDGLAASLKKRLEDEKAIRDKFPKGDPRREGGPTNATTYPILFEFGIDQNKDDVVRDKTVKATKAGNLPGEGFVKSKVPLATTLKRAWCPAANVEALTAALKDLFPDTAVEVLPLEALQALPRKKGDAGEVLWSTYNKLKLGADKMETARDLLVKTHEGRAL